MEASHGWVPVNTHSIPVPGTPGRLWVARYTETTGRPRHDLRRAQHTPQDLRVAHGGGAHAVPQNHIQKSCLGPRRVHRSHDVNESRTSRSGQWSGFQESGFVVEVFVCQRKATGVVRRRECDEITFPVPRIPTQMVERTAECRRFLPLKSQCQCRKSPHKRSFDHIQHLNCRQRTFQLRMSRSRECPSMFQCQ